MIGNKNGRDDKLPVSGHLGNSEQIVHPPIKNILGRDLNEKMVKAFEKSKRVNAN